jgi:hypothetical protein
MQTQTMVAYHGNPKIKAKYLKRVRAHAKDDELVQGYGYWKDGKGCAVGCTLHGSDHKAYETELGIPVTIAHLEDCIFERLPTENARKWPSKFLGSIRPGADLSLVTARFMVWLLGDSEKGVIRFTDATTRPCVETVVNLYQRLIDGGIVSDYEWAEAAEAAARAAEAAARAAATAARAARAAEAAEAATAATAAWAATAAARAAEAAARAAATAARAAEAAAWAARAAEAAHYQRMADKLIELLSNAPLLIP